MPIVKNGLERGETREIKEILKKFDKICQEDDFPLERRNEYLKARTKIKTLIEEGNTVVGTNLGKASRSWIYKVIVKTSKGEEIIALIAKDEFYS